MLDNWARKALNKESIDLHGDGTQRRDFIHVEDVAEALYSAYNAKLDEEILDIGTGKAFQISDLAREFGTDINPLFELPGYAHSTQAKAQRTMELLNWAPNHNPITWIRSTLGK